VSTGKVEKRYPAEILTAAEIRALLAACNGTTLTGMRNRALLVVLWRAGLRCAEALDLRPADVDFGAGTIRVLHGKGDRARTVGADGQALDVVRAWLGARQAAGVESPYLFCTTEGGRMSSRYVRAMTGRLARQAGIVHRVHPHGLRHCHAVELVSEGWPVTLIQQQLGHASTSTTDIYLRHLRPAEVIDRARARTWAS
jgi:site-specific recombinase XerD